MAQLEHLVLVRLPEQLPRRKKPGFGSNTPREHHAHAEKLQQELITVVHEKQSKQVPGYIDPSLILKVKMLGVSHEEGG